MSLIFAFTRNWNACYRVLRHRNGFGVLESMRYGLWLVRGRVETAMTQVAKGEAMARFGLPSVGALESCSVPHQ
jgi:hypothetical protein